MRTHDAPPIHSRHRYSVSDGKNDVISHVEIEERPGAYWLTNVWTDPDHRGKGYAGALMDRAVTEWGDQDLYLQVQPYTDQPLGTEQLRTWYGTFGFADTAVPGVMLRVAGFVPSRNHASTTTPDR